MAGKPGRLTKKNTSTTEKEKQQRKTPCHSCLSCGYPCHDWVKADPVLLQISQTQPRDKPRDRPDKGLVMDYN